MDFLGFLLGAGAFWLVLAARARITRLEHEVVALRQALPHAGALAESPPEAAADAYDTAETPRAKSQRDNAMDADPRPADATPEHPAPAPKRVESALARLGPWLRDHWIYPTAGAALVLSGIFLVQYAVETGLLTPQARVILALLLGAALAAGGEWLRHRPLAGQSLPATLTGAGLVIAMAAVLAALHLYEMIAPATALVALALLSLGAIALGWLHGPMLSALGLVAGTGVPFVLGGGGPPPPVLFGYFALLALAGMGIDAKRRWGWVTWLALAGPLAAMVLWRLAGADALGFAIAVLVVAGAAMTLPFGYIAPLVEGPRALGRETPVQGVRASFAASAVAAIGLALLVPGMAGPAGLALLAALIAIWCARAPALADQMLLPVLAFPLWIVWQAVTYGPVFGAFNALRPPESAMPLQVSQILVLSVLAGLAMIWRGEADAPGRHAPFTLAGLALPGAAIVALETMWLPATMLGSYIWALHAMALAAMATALALRYGLHDRGQGPRLGAAAAAAFALVALGLMLMLGQSALTIALAVLMVAAGAMDRRFDIPALGAFQILASMTLIWRLVLAPGLDWHLDDAAMPEMLASLVATLGGPLLALWLTQPLRDDPLRRHARLVSETGLMASVAIAFAILIARVLPEQTGLHAQLGLHASVLIALAWVQIRRAALPVLPQVRRGLAWVFGLIAGVSLFCAAVYPASPVFGDWPFVSLVAGWPVLNDLILAYLLPAVLLVTLAGWRWLWVAGCGLGALWVATVIRHLWQGTYMQLSRGIEQGELYAYTFALLVAGAALLARALLTARADLRKLGLLLAGLAAAKAFLIDAGELDGLLRVGAFLALGLTLAGLAWLNGWAVAREGNSTPNATNA
ncbi:DUF2339 domain-containing protein [Roseinatronobacter alkalisoli]|uniref:DUF2339 domain-containing protein n=1 Tax=Roseinatronobacter alkalisoli TaxID=3028235 RepID=A0ABT5T507_9RHOB|nr:DUF2339 domain-containing protein [Roseinatronobacter sp. HJB301]MDD7970193.1 DUF2339 domain-containing protein [Roseinatronobacter sp. HJB301]